MCFKKIVNGVLSVFGGKEFLEYRFQRVWVKEFVENKRVVLDYWVRFRRLNQIRRIIGPMRDLSVLDVGCGISTVLHFIDAKTKIGIDPLMNKYRKIYSYPKDIVVRQAYAEAIPYINGTFDIVFCSNALDHMEDPKTALLEMVRVLKPQGYLVITVEVFERSCKRNKAHPNTLTEDDFVEILPIGLVQKMFVCSKWFGLQNYVRGGQARESMELITVYKKNDRGV